MNVCGECGAEIMDALGGLPFCPNARTDANRRRLFERYDSKRGISTVRAWQLAYEAFPPADSERLQAVLGRSSENAALTLIRNRSRNVCPDADPDSPERLHYWGPKVNALGTLVHKCLSCGVIREARA
jgi:hypothetical protein